MTAEVISFLRPGVNIIFLLPCLSCLLLGQPFGLWAVGFGFPHFDSFTSVMLLQNIHSWMRISTRLTPHSTSGYLKLVHPHTTGVWEDRRRACSGRIVAAQLQVWFGSLRPVPMEHTARHLELYYTLRDCWCNQLHVWYLSLIMIELKIQWKYFQIPIFIPTHIGHKQNNHAWQFGRIYLLA